MASKLFVALFALLAVGWASAGVVPLSAEEFDSDGDLAVLQALMAISPDQLIDADIDVDADLDDETKGDPSKCTQYVQEAYNTATEVKRIITEAKALGKKLAQSLQKCKALPTLPEKKKCAKEAVKAIIPEAKKLVQAWKTVKPKIGEIYDKFTKCLA